MAAFDSLIRAGKVRAIGASNLRSWRIAEANAVAGAHGCARYSAVEQRRGITLIAYSALLQGAYTRPDRPLPAQYSSPDADARLEALRGVAEEAGAIMNQVVIAWMRQSGPPVPPIIAGSQPGQVAENIAALNVALSEDQIRRLDTAGNPDIKKAWLRLLAKGWR
jgi:aryl-alcohol dehydrogenase-like predicted oxidoreductase